MANNYLNQTLLSAQAAKKVVEDHRFWMDPRYNADLSKAADFTWVGPTDDLLPVRAEYEGGAAAASFPAYATEHFNHGIESAALHVERMGLKLVAREIRDLKRNAENGSQE